MTRVPTYATGFTNGRRWRGTYGFLAAAVLVLSPMTASAQITNEATAGGTYDGATITSSPSASSVPVAPPNQSLTVAVVETRFDADVAGNSDLGPGDTLTFDVSVTNTGNVTLDDVIAVPEAIEFAGQAFTSANLRSGPQAPVTLAPGAEETFSYVYTLTAQDIYSAAGRDDAVTSSWSADATGRLPDTAVTVGGSTDTVPAAPGLTIAKSFTIANDEGLAQAADPGDVIVYTYVVTNTGNVPLSNVHVVDTHESGEAHEVVFDSSAYTGVLGTEPGQWDLSETTPAVFGDHGDDDASDAVFATLGVGSAVTFTYAHQVTQAEFDAQ